MTFWNPRKRFIDCREFKYKMMLHVPQRTTQFPFFETDIFASPDTQMGQVTLYEFLRWTSGTGYPSLPNIHSPYIVYSSEKFLLRSGNLAIIE